MHQGGPYRSPPGSLLFRNQCLHRAGPLVRNQCILLHAMHLLCRSVWKAQNACANKLQDRVDVRPPPPPPPTHPTLVYAAV